MDPKSTVIGEHAPFLAQTELHPHHSKRNIEKNKH